MSPAENIHAGRGASTEPQEWRRVFLAVLVVAAAATPGVATRAAAAPVFLVSESDADVAPLRARMEGVETTTIASWNFWRGTLAGVEIVLARTDPGPLNAVAATMLAIRRFQPRRVVTFGTARAHDPGLRPLDAIVAARFVPFDGFVTKRREEGEGSEPREWKKLPHAVMTKGGREVYTDSFEAAPELASIAGSLTNRRGRVVAGTLGSAWQVNREADHVAWLRETWGTDAEDAISAHVAVCAQLFEIPAGAVRVIVAPDASAAEITEASALGAALVEQLLERSAVEAPVES